MVITFSYVFLVPLVFLLKRLVPPSEPGPVADAAGHCGNILTQRGIVRS
jgi:hypothetical protein